MFWHAQHLRNLPELAHWAEPQREKLVANAFFLVIFVSIAGNFAAGAIAKWLGYRRVDRHHVSRLLHRDVSHLFAAARIRRTLLVLVPGSGFLLRRFRPLHDVPSAAFPDAAAHDRRRLLLQYRPHRRGLRHGLFRPVFQGGRLPHRAASTPASSSSRRRLVAWWLPEPARDAASGELETPAGAPLAE